MPIKYDNAKGKSKNEIFRKYKTIFVIYFERGFNRPDCIVKCLPNPL